MAIGTTAAFLLGSAIAAKGFMDYSDGKSQRRQAGQAVDDEKKRQDDLLKKQEEERNNTNSRKEAINNRKRDVLRQKSQRSIANRKSGTLLTDQREDKVKEKRTTGFKTLLGE